MAHTTTVQYCLFKSNNGFFPRLKRLLFNLLNWLPRYIYFVNFDNGITSTIYLRLTEGLDSNFLTTVHQNGFLVHAWMRSWFSNTSTTLDQVGWIMHSMYIVYCTVYFMHRSS
jgi:hypothetical protein